MFLSLVQNHENQLLFTINFTIHCTPLKFVLLKKTKLFTKKHLNLIKSHFIKIQNKNFASKIHTQILSNKSSTSKMYN